MSGASRVVRGGLLHHVLRSLSAVLLIAGSFAAGSMLPAAEGTPAPKPLTPEQENAALEADWMFQADELPTMGRALDEVKWTRQLAARLQRDARTLDLSEDLAQLDALVARYAKDVVPTEPSRPKLEMPPGAISCWTLDGSADGAYPDACDPQRRGEIVGRIDRYRGVAGDCMRLTPNACLKIAENPPRIATGNYSISAWIRTNAGAADVVGTGVGPGHVLLMVYQGVVRGHHWTAASGNVLDGKTRVADGQWHHIAQVVDDRRIALYVDGKLDAEQPFQGEKIAAPDVPMWIGVRGGDHSPSYFNGMLDEVAIFDRPLTADELAAMHQQGLQSVGAVDEEAKEFYLAVRQIKRRIMMKDPAIDFSQVLLLDHPYPTGGEWPHQARHRDGMMAVPGGRLLVLDGLHPGAAVRQLAPTEDKQASFWRPDLSFDGQKVLFCMKPAEERSFHLYEMNVDGTGLRQLTNSPYDDLDPIYLPDGHILFTSTRCNTYIRCMPYTYCYVLARCDADGKNIYLVSRNNECDWVPALLGDGRVVYSRWEYHDKALWRIQSLWSMNPDGTAVSAFYGNQSVWPDHLTEPRPIPGSERVMFTGLAHHDWFSGSIGIIDPKAGFNFPAGLTKVTAEVAWPECGTPPLDPVEADDYHASGAFTAYKTPYPLSEELFLVSARGGPNRTPGGDHFRLYLMDVHGNRELIYAGEHHIWHAIPVKPRPMPPIKADTVAWPGTGEQHRDVQPGVMYSIDVYEGVPDLPRGMAKYLQVIQMDHRTYSTWNRDGRFSGPVVSAIQDDGVKRILGTATIEQDGSVAFEVPPGQALHFQLLDENYRALQTMRSFTGAMPGERRGCVGCHESQEVAPPVHTVMAMRKPPQKLVPPPWGAETTIGYERLVQPVLEKHCGACHTGDGEGRKALDLTLRPGAGPFKEPYLTLVGEANYFRLPGAPAGPGIAGALKAENFAQSDPNSYVTFRPLQYLSYTSKLIELATSGEHYKVKVTGNDLRQLIGWVDANCPYRGDPEIREIPDPDPIQFGNLPILPRTKTAPRIDRFNVPQDTVPQRDMPAAIDDQAAR